MSTLPPRIAIVFVVSLALTGREASADAPDGRYRAMFGWVLDTRTGLTWQQSTPQSAIEGAPNAESYCFNLGLDGYGWRLPTLKELLSLVDYTQTEGPTIDLGQFPTSYARAYWTATPVAASPSDYWVVDFQDARAWSQANVAPSAYVRCVR